MWLMTRVGAPCPSSTVTAVTAVTAHPAHHRRLESARVVEERDVLGDLDELINVNLAGAVRIGQLEKVDHLARRDLETHLGEGGLRWQLQRLQRLRDLETHLGEGDLRWQLQRLQRLRDLETHLGEGGLRWQGGGRAFTSRLQRGCIAVGGRLQRSYGTAP